MGLKHKMKLKHFNCLIPAAVDNKIYLDSKI
jgi:hypothetical protein